MVIFNQDYSEFKLNLLHIFFKRAHCTKILIEWITKLVKVGSISSKMRPNMTFYKQILKIDIWGKSWRQSYNLQNDETKNLTLLFLFSFQVWDLNFENWYKVDACSQRSRELFVLVNLTDYRSFLLDSQSYENLVL